MKYTIISLLIAIVFGFSAIPTAQALNNNGVLGTRTTGTQEIGGITFPANTGLVETPVSVIILAVVRWITLVFSSIAVIMIVICGLKYITSAGDSTAVESAKSCIKWSIVGIIVSLSAMIVIKFVYTTLMGF